MFQKRGSIVSAWKWLPFEGFDNQSRSCMKCVMYESLSSIIYVWAGKQLNTYNLWTRHSRATGLLYLTAQVQCGQITLIFSRRTAVYDGPFQERATLCHKFQNEIAVSQGTWQFGNCLMPAKWVFRLLKGCVTSRNFYLLPVSHPIIKLPRMTCAVIGSHIWRRSKCSVPLAFQQTVIQ